MIEAAPLVPRQVVRGLRVAVLVVSAVLTAFFINAVVQRFRYPVELEWMSGTVLDTVERVLQGKPVYVAPSVAWVPFMYPPLYTWLSAALAKAMPIVTACRLVSIAATLTSAVLVFRTARVLRATPFWAIAAVGLFFACYALTGYWYDIERSDSLCSAMILAGVLVAVESAALPGAAAAGVIFGLAFFAKQPALLVACGTCVGLAASGQWKRAAAFAVGAGVVLVSLGTWLHVTTHGWWDFYCLEMGAKHGIGPKLFTVFAVIDLSNGFVLTAATFALVGWVARDLLVRARSHTWDAADAPLVTFACALAAAFLASGLSRLHVGGWLNVLIFWSSIACIAVAVVASRIEQAAQVRGMGGLVASGLALGVLLQLGHLAYDPAEPCPTAQRVIDQRIVADEVRELEKSGEVLLTGRGHVTHPRHFHAAAMMDVMRGGYGIPADLVRGLEERRYAAWILDEWGELTLEAIVGHRSELFDLVMANYYVAERLDDREPPPVVGWIAHPSWILKPRKHPLLGRTFEQLDARRRVEMGLAELRMRERQAGVTPVGDDESIEETADAILHQRAAAIRAEGGGEERAGPQGRRPGANSPAGATN